MESVDKVSELENFSYFVDLDWFQENGRSFDVVVWHCLCPDCQKRLASEREDMTSAMLLTNIRDCCSKAVGFISPKLPLLEKVFRVLLSKGNKQLSLKELIVQLGSCTDNPASLSPEGLKRLLDNDQHYGFRSRLG